ncbi:MAG: hypothetical protein UX26_C0011G0007 [Parcubacteria group bacterium GW2011_GWC1_45_9]|nr:MAG: hypothetical protein UW85_C0003G0011 [Parcubacteria group bacterium GW2011_GWA1_Parcubacteria_45_10]KKT88802.1 MAG: hypothetical protein UW89_C0004G0001 [Parcubacteria group bacterium GW2011_GWB1_45_10]KKU16952.1 MAG: hypothetical protein UX26_C0011G0007 [Parcubacteria group bacterium GW2011_GWC1_45_9]HCI05612.1 hypothetical protein [Patescibacteria group bacterium]
MKQNPSTKKQTLIALRKAQSLVKKIIQMIDEGVYCVRIMEQNLAVVGLLRSAHEKLLENHLNTCFREAIGSRDEKRKQEMIKEILKVVKLANK